MDRLDAMTTLIDVVAERSFAAAGRKRRLPRAVVSKHIQSLEEAFGARFFHRSTRRLSLTAAGTRFYEHCLKIVAAVNEAAADVDESADAKPRGRLRITAPAAFSELHLMTHLASFAKLHPAIELDVDCSERFVDFVSEGFDVGIRICVSPPPGLVAKKLARSSIVICASPAYLKKRGRPTQPDDLAQHDCIGWVYQSNASAWDLSDGQRVRIRPRHRTNDNRLLRHLAVAGEGLAQLPSYFVGDEIASGRLVTVLDRHRDRSRSVFLIYAPKPPPKVRVLVEHLSRAFGDERW